MDAQAFQHLLPLFPLLTLRQRRVTQHELTESHSITQLLAAAPHCQAEVAKLEPRTPLLPLQTMFTHQFSTHQDTLGQIAQGCVLRKLSPDLHQSAHRPLGSYPLHVVCKNTAF